MPNDDNENLQRMQSIVSDDFPTSPKKEENKNDYVMETFAKFGLNMGLWTGETADNKEDTQEHEVSGPKDEDDDLKWVLDQVPDLTYLVSSKVVVPAWTLDGE